MPEILNAQYVFVSNFFGDFMHPRYCSDVFESPILITRCGHNFCQNCLKDVTKKKFKKLNGKNKGKEGWICPVCRKFYDCTYDTLTRNFQLETLTEKFLAQRNLNNQFGTCALHNRAMEFRKQIIEHKHEFLQYYDQGLNSVDSYYQTV